MNSTVPFASDLSFQVFEKQRRDPQVVLTPPHKPVQIRESRLQPDEMFRVDEIVRSEEIPVGRFWKHGKR